uniref:hypothetical protein n=1 Tax=Mycoplasmopsis felifaucium TaxID=35768 RepID=UPI0004802D27
MKKLFKKLALPIIGGISAMTLPIVAVSCGNKEKAKEEVKTSTTSSNTTATNNTETTNTNTSTTSTAEITKPAPEVPTTPGTAQDESSKYMNPEAYKLSEQNKLFVIDETKKDEIANQFDKAIATQAGSIGIKNAIVTIGNQKENIDGITLGGDLGSSFSTHGTKTTQIGTNRFKLQDKNSTRKGIFVQKTEVDGQITYTLYWQLYLVDGKTLGEKEYSLSLAISKPVTESETVPGTDVSPTPTTDETKPAEGTSEGSTTTEQPSTGETTTTPVETKDQEEPKQPEGTTEGSTTTEQPT